MAQSLTYREEKIMKNAEKKLQKSKHLFLRNFL